MGPDKRQQHNLNSSDMRDFYNNVTEKYVPNKFSLWVARQRI